MRPNLVFINEGTDKGRSYAGAGIANTTVYHVTVFGFDLLEVSIVQR